MTGPALSDNAKALIYKFEGLDQPRAWPGGASGVSIGIGYDLGYVSHDEFAKDWRGTLPPADFIRLYAVVGLKGDAAHDIAASLRGITISLDEGKAIFEMYDVPTYAAMTELVFPGASTLPPDAFGALFSLVFNRGSSMTGDRRAEMRAIRILVNSFAKNVPLVSATLLAGIAAQLRSMKRLWGPDNSPGLIPRREAEAVLVESCIPS